MSDEILNRVLAAMTEVRTQMTSLQTELISNRESIRKEIKDRLDEFRADLTAQRNLLVAGFRGDWIRLQGLGIAAFGFYRLSRSRVPFLGGPKWREARNGRAFRRS